MLSEEVLDSIQILKFLHDKCNSEKSIGMMQVYRVDELAKAIETILNFIGKQQKEIEKLKENKGYHLGFIDGGIAKRYEMQDKIKSKIEEIIQILEAKPYTAYTLYGDILHESDEIAQMLKEVLKSYEKEN